jgi:hypothetical protein
MGSSCRFKKQQVPPLRFGGVIGLRPTQGDEKRLQVQQPLSMEASPSPLSSRAQPRDLQFSGPFVEMFFNRSEAEWRDLLFFSIPEHPQAKNDNRPRVRSGYIAVDLRLQVCGGVAL